MPRPDPHFFFRNEPHTMSEIVSLLFPGQGSQHLGMGRALAEAFPLARETFAEADDALGIHLSRIMWEGPLETLTETRHAQPAILAHSIAALRVLGPRAEAIAMGAGHSLGEFSAHVAAGSWSFDDALRAVRLRGELMFAAGQARPGSMAAVLGIADEEVDRICQAASSPGAEVVVANLNSEGQIVVSGDTDALARVADELREAGAKRVVPLTVSGAFHSPLMEPAQEGLRQELSSISFNRPEWPVVSNVTGTPVTDAAAIPELLVRQLVSPVRWRESIERMVAEGTTRFLELGPGSVLTGLNRRNARGVPTVAVGEPEAFDKLDP